MTNIERVYCLHRCADGSFLLLRRDYKPWQAWASWNGIWADYDTCSGTRVSLTESQIRRLENGCQPYVAGDTKIWMFSDRTRPEKSRAHLVAYEARLALLGTLGEIRWAA